MKHLKLILNNSQPVSKEAAVRMKIKAVSAKIEEQRIERLRKKPLSVEEQIITGNLSDKK